MDGVCTADPACEGEDCGCYADRDCAEDQICDVADHACVAIECYADYACPIGARCRDHRCQVDVEADRDLDGVPDGVANDPVDRRDNCPEVPNTDQNDTDGDGDGDACDEDLDGDAVANDADNCPQVPNPDQEDVDLNNVGDACEQDRDLDGVYDHLDNCLVDANADQQDTDRDTVGDACDADDDNDGVLDDEDNCPLTPNPSQADADANATGNACDAGQRGTTVVGTVDFSAGGNPDTALARVFISGRGEPEGIDPEGRFVFDQALPDAGEFLLRVEWPGFDAALGFFNAPDLQAEFDVGTIVLVPEARGQSAVDLRGTVSMEGQTLAADGVVVRARVRGELVETTWTEPDGDFVLRVGREDYTLTFAREGFEELTVTAVWNTQGAQAGRFTVDGIPLEETPLVLRALPSSQLTGQLRSQGQVIDDWANRAFVTLTSTDETTRRIEPVLRDGSFQFTALTPGFYSLSVSARGHQPLTLDALELAPGDNPQGTILLTPDGVELATAAFMTGFAHLADRDPTGDNSGIVVRARVGSNLVASTTTAEDGAWFLQVSRDTHVLSFSKEGYQTINEITVSFFDDGQGGGTFGLTVDEPVAGASFVLAPLLTAAVSGDVVSDTLPDLDDWPSRGFAALIRDDDAVRRIEPLVNAAAGHGHFQFTTVPPGVYTLAISAQGHRPSSQQVTVGTSDLVLPLQTLEFITQAQPGQAAVLRARALIDGATSHEGIVVRAFVAGNLVATTITGEDGVFAFQTAPDHHTLSFRLPGYQPQSADIRWDGTASRFEFEDAPLSDVVPLVTLQAAPFAGDINVTVDIAPDWLQQPDRPVGVQVRLISSTDLGAAIEAATTATDGDTISFTPLPRGSYLVVVERSGFSTAERLITLDELSPSHTLNVAVQLENLALAGINLSDRDISDAQLRELGPDALRGADLSGIHVVASSGAVPRLCGLDLSGASLVAADLDGADLSGARLTGANLSNASLADTDLTGADLRGASFFGANLLRVDLSGQLTAEEVAACDRLGDADVGKGADLAGADFSSANLTNATLSEARFLAHIDRASAPHRAFTFATPVVDTLAVQGCSAIRGITVDLGLTADRQDDNVPIEVRLTAPDGTLVLLHTQGLRTLVGTYPTDLTPVQPLDTLTGLVGDGDWTLSVMGSGSPLIGGTLDTWGLHLDCNATSAVEQDRAPGLRVQYPGAAGVDTLVIQGCPVVQGITVDLALKDISGGLRGVQASLTSPDGTSVLIVDDSPYTRDAGGTYPYPQTSAQSLAAFDGGVGDGTWTLTFTLIPAAPNRTGQGFLTSWGIHLECAAAGVELQPLPSSAAAACAPTARRPAINLRDVVFTQTNLSGAFMDGVDLRDSQGGGADLSSALLKGTALNRTCLRGSSFILTNLRDARLNEADLRPSPGGNTALFLGSILRDAQLKGALLDDVDMTGANLVGTDFTGAALPRANLLGIIADHTRFTGADLTDSVASGVVFAAADFSNADLSRSADASDAEGIWRNSVFVGCRFDGQVQMSRLQLRGAVFASESLSGVNLERAELRGADLSAANLTGARLVGADLVGADLARADLSGADLASDNLFDPASRANLSNANLSGANLTGANLNGSRLPGVNLSRARMQNTTLTNTDLFDANLTHALLPGARLAGASLIDADLTGADLHGAQLVTFANNNHYDGANFRFAILADADLSGADATLVDFGHADLSGANLTGANLTDTILKDAVLTDADLTDADLTRAALKNADISNADLTRTDLTSAGLRSAILVGATFSPVSVARACYDGSTAWPDDFVPDPATTAPGIYHIAPGVQLPGADLRNADLRDANLYFANLASADLTGADLTGANLAGANLTGATFTRAIYDSFTAWPDGFDPTAAAGILLIGPGVDLQRANLAGEDLSGANLSEADLSGVHLEGADLSGADLSGANIFGAYLEGANLQGADLTGADLSGDRLSNADLRRADLTGANLNSANLTGANLYGADLSHADLRSANLTGVDLFGTNLSFAYYNAFTVWPEGFDPTTVADLYLLAPNANLTGADLQGVNLTSTNLSGADLSNALLSGANLSMANLSMANLSNADLVHADLYDARLPGANLRNADLWNANVVEADLAGADLTNTRLPGAIYSAGTTWPNGFNPGGVPTLILLGPNRTVPANKDLSGFILDNLDLTSATLRFVNLSDARLSGATLSSADMTSTNLTRANLNRTRLLGTRLSNANLSHAVLNFAFATDAHFNLADLSYADLSNAELTNTWLHGADLRGAYLTNANLTNANLYLANLTGADLANANLTGVVWSNTICPDGTNSDNNMATCEGHL